MSKATTLITFSNEKPNRYEQALAAAEKRNQKPGAPKFNNQSIHRSDGRNDNKYNDWRNW